MTARAAETRQELFRALRAALAAADTALAEDTARRIGLLTAEEEAA